ncbi:cell envelope integrity protein TolA [Oceanobacter mangrovi]|uniref:cell envelope integrity protein TolA n=1 Tax=Oceanobacter mangrovi TaxID=2862510 RepID=UPI001C8DB8EE
MAKPFNPSSYTPAIIAAVILHILVAGLFWFQWPADERHIAQPVPKHITATVVQQPNQAAAERKKQQDVQAQQARAAAERKRQAELAARRKQEADAAAKKQRDAEIALKKKQLAEQQAREKKAKDDAAKAAADRKKQAEAAAAKAEADRKAQEADLQRQLAEEQAMLERLTAEQAERELQQRQQQEEQAAKDQEAISSFESQIMAKVSRAWMYPPGVAPDMEVSVRVNLVPTGEVISVSVIKSSGNTALDRSVEQAVMKASPLPVPQDVRIFEKNFRTFSFTFRPENATW